MQKEVTKLENSQTNITLSFSGEEWANAQKKAFNKLANNVEVQGFRKGHAPENLVRQKINQAQVLNDAIDVVLQPAYEQVLKEEKLVPFVQPELEVTKISESELEVIIKITTAPEVTLGSYKGLKVAREAVEVTKEEIDAEIARLCANNAELIVKDTEAKLGDTTVIDFKGFVDGKEFDGGSAENFALELGSNQFVPGFEEQLVGTKAGESKDVVVTFPTQYVPELAGKEATFKVTVNEVKEKKVPELNEDLVAELNYEGVKTVEDLTNKVSADVKTKKENQAKNAQIEEILKQIRESSTISIGEKIIEKEVESMKENFKKQVEQNGLTIDQYYQITGQKEEDTVKSMRAQAELNLKNFLVISEISKLENIKVEQKELDAEYQKIADQYGMDVAKVKEILGPQSQQLASDIHQRKIIDFLLANNE
ncbi:MAG: trigger factor [Bacilli bacterium]|nr:trigger factor [Bacilli bacterium]